MKIVFVSNYFNHHQKPFCEAMYERIGANFTFIATSVMREERRQLGYAQDDHPPYVLLAYEGEERYKKSLELINGADVVIAGSAPDKMLRERILKDKLLLRYSERPFKKKVSFLRKAYHWINFRKRDMFKKNIYMLCAGAYAANDYASLGMYRNRMYKWGYFPAVKEYDQNELFLRKKCNTILWCGRFLDWKHPDDAIKVAKMLKYAGYDYRLNLIGTGNMDADLQRLVEGFDLSDRVHFLGSMPPEQVRLHMEEAGIYLFTSDRREGWGAVLNESMNSACAVVASSDIGSASYLIHNNENGAIYESGNINELFEKVLYFLKHPEEQRRAGLNAYETVLSKWNADMAVERLMEFVEEINKCGTFDAYEDGPCSKAHPM